MHCSYRRYRKWSLLYCLILACLLGILGLFNYLVDPLWCFSHGYHLGRYRKPFDERQQKTNHLTFASHLSYDAVILGSSRAALINQNDFVGMKAYNYAQAGMTTYEYGEYIDYFKRTVVTPRVIILGLSFNNTVGGVYNNGEKPAHYIAMANSPFYRFKTLFTAGVFHYSWDNLRMQHFLDHNKRWAGHMLYDHANVATVIPPNDMATAQIKMKETLSDLAKSYERGYRYGEDLKGSLQKLRADNPGSRFMIFTTPVTEGYYCTLVRAGRLPEYERGLREMVEVFGQVWHFEYPHSIARNPANYWDAHHFYPPVGTLIAHRMTGVPDPKIPEDFGMLLTPATIDSGLERVRAASVTCLQSIEQKEESGSHEK